MLPELAWKVCTGLCKEPKLLKHFAIQKTYRNQRRCECNNCRNVHQRAHYAKHGRKDRIKPKKVILESKLCNDLTTMKW